MPLAKRVVLWIAYWETGACGVPATSLGCGAFGGFGMESLTGDGGLRHDKYRENKGLIWISWDLIG